MELEQICQGAKAASQKLATLGTNEKNQALTAVASALVAASADIIAANKEDLENGKKNHMPEGLLDRLMLNKARIAQIAEGLQQVAALDDPIGEVLSMKKRPNGLMIGKKRVPLGVVGMIYEARPNVTVDAFGLCFKTGNAVILKGGSDAIHSNIAIVSVIQKTLEQLGIPKEAASLIEDTSRDTAAAFMKMNQYVDVLIPRGGAGLIRAVVNQATIPVIETGTGNCHIFVDETADFDMAVNIIMNAKTQRIGVCNACESLVIHEKIVDTFMPKLTEALQKKNVELHAGHHEVVQWLGLTFNIDTLIATWVTMAIVILITVLATRGRKLVPVGLQNIVESILEGLEGQLAPNLGRHWPMVSSLLFTFFLFIFVGNELGLMPTLKALTSPTSDINTTVALALCSTLVVWVMGIKVKGLSYFKHFVRPYKALLILNIFEEIARPVTLAFRLFGNIVAGEILLEVLYNLPWFVPVPWIWIAFSLFIGIIQAFIFTVLTASYLGMALSEEH